MQTGRENAPFAHTEKEKKEGVTRVSALQRELLDLTRRGRKGAIYFLFEGENFSTSEL